MKMSGRGYTIFRPQLNAVKKSALLTIILTSEKNHLSLPQWLARPKKENCPSDPDTKQLHLGKSKLSNCR